MILIFFILFLAGSFVASERFKFDNYTLYKILPKDSSDFVILQELYENDRRFDFWDDPIPTAEYLNVVAAPHDKIDLENILIQNNVAFIPTNYSEHTRVSILCYCHTRRRKVWFDCRLWTLAMIKPWLSVSAYDNTVLFFVSNNILSLVENTTD